MSLFSKRTVKDLLKKYKIQPTKRLGQNFLVNKKVVKKIIRSANLSPNDTVLEIGPGMGNLTQELAKRAKKVIAVEKDPRMGEILKELLEGWNVGNVIIIRGDILKIELKTYNLKPKAYKVVANIPYYLTSPLIRKFLEEKCPPKLMVLMLQKEVAQRICASQLVGGKSPKMNLLAVSVQFYAEPKIIAFVSKKSFWPQPKVDSAIIKITPRQKLLESESNSLFFKIVKAGFSQPRKQLLNNLSKKLNTDKEKIKNWLLENNIQPTQRAETLTVQDWIKLTRTL